jgi:hypothetical protein
MEQSLPVHPEAHLQVSGAIHVPPLKHPPRTVVVHTDTWDEAEIDVELVQFFEKVAENDPKSHRAPSTS